MRRDLTKEKAQAKKMHEDNPSMTPHEIAKAFKVSDVTAYKWFREWEEPQPQKPLPSLGKPMSQVTLGEFVQALYDKYVEVIDELKAEKEKSEKMQKVINDLEESLRLSHGEDTTKVLDDFQEILGKV